MNTRSPLKDTIIEAWISAIDGDYERQRINSERSLQASFWAQLNTLLPKTRRIFIEPSIQIRTSTGIKTRFPDIVVCNTREIISLIELKYTPKKQPDYLKDIDSLALIAANRRQVTVSNSRFRGNEVDSKTYVASRNMLFVWAGIHAKPKHPIVELYSAEHKPLAKSFIQLHAETKDKKTPEIYYYQ